MTNRNRLRIAQVAPPLEAVPPPGYGGTERIIDDADRRARAARPRGHPVRERRLHGAPRGWCPRSPGRSARRAWPREDGAVSRWPRAAVLARGRRVRRRSTPTSTSPGSSWPGQPDVPTSSPSTAGSTGHGPRSCSRTRRPGLVRDQRGPGHRASRASPGRSCTTGSPWPSAPFEPSRARRCASSAGFMPEKGLAEAVEIARRAGRRLRVAAKEPATPAERDYFEKSFRPAGRSADVEYLGELGPARSRPALRRRAMRP